MKHLFLAILVFGFFSIGCKPTINEIFDSNSSIDSIDYTVISCAIEQYFFIPNTLSHRFESTYDSLKKENWIVKHDEIKMLLINDSTIRFEDSIPHFVHKKHNEIDSLDTKLTESIIDVNNKRYKIDNSRITTIKTQLITDSEITNLLDSSFYYGYERIYEKFPAAYGIIELSKPAYNASKEKTIIYIGFKKEMQSGQGVYMWLKKVNNKWITYDLAFLWEL